MSLALRRLSSVWATQPTDPKPTDPPAEFDLAESDDGDVAEMELGIELEGEPAKLRR